MADDLKYMEEMLAEMLDDLSDIDIDEQKLSGFTDKLFEHFGVLAPLLSEPEQGVCNKMKMLGINLPHSKSPERNCALNVFYTLSLNFFLHSGLIVDSVPSSFNNLRRLAFDETKQTEEKKIYRHMWDYFMWHKFPQFSEETKTKTFSGTRTFEDLKEALAKHSDYKLLKELLDAIEDYEKRKMEEAVNDPNKKPTDETVDFTIDDPEIKRLFLEIRKKAKENDIYKEINDIIKECPKVIGVLGKYLHEINLIVLYVKNILNAYAKNIFIEVIEELCKKLKKYPKNPDTLDEFEKICLDSQNYEDAIKKILPSNLKLEDLVEQHPDICGVIVAKFYSIVYVHEFIHMYHYRIGLRYEGIINNGYYAFETKMAEDFEKIYHLGQSRNDFMSKIDSPDGDLLCEALAQYFEILYMKYIGEYSLAGSTVEDLKHSSVAFPYRGALVFYEKQPDPIMDNQVSARINKYNFAKKYITNPDTKSFKDEYDTFNKKSAT